MRHKVTITLDEETYSALKARAGAGGMSRYVSKLVRGDALTDGYSEMAADPASEAEALEWTEELIGDVSNDGC
jgi:hypothetical protein